MYESYTSFFFESCFAGLYSPLPYEGDACGCSLNHFFFLFFFLMCVHERHIPSFKPSFLFFFFFFFPCFPVIIRVRGDKKSTASPTFFPFLSYCLHHYEAIVYSLPIFFYFFSALRPPMNGEAFLHLFQLSL